MSLGVFIFTGLDTNPSGDCCGMRAMAERLFPGVDVYYHGYDEKPLPDHNVDSLCRLVMESMQKYDELICFGHSFGGAFLKFFGDWANHWHPGTVKINKAVFFDPAPNAELGQFCAWQIAQSHDASRWHLSPVFVSVECFTQHNMQLLGIAGVCGVPFNQEAASAAGISVTNIDVTPWGLFHSSMIPDSRVQADIDSFIGSVPIPSSLTGVTE